MAAAMIPLLGKVIALYALRQAWRSRHGWPPESRPMWAPPYLLAQDGRIWFVGSNAEIATEPIDWANAKAGK